MAFPPSSGIGESLLSRLAFVPSSLTLGTVQIGMPYGMARIGEPPDQDDSFAILDAALAGGITTLDTARAYGESEARIGAWLDTRGRPAMRIVSKFAPLPTGTAAERRAALAKSLAATEAALGRSPDLIMLHREHDGLDPQVQEELCRLTDAGRIAAIGASVYTPAHALELLDQPWLAAMQLPASVADRRFDQAGVLAKAAARGVAVFVRSVFMQGALLTAPERLPAHLAALAVPLQRLREIAASLDIELSALLLLALRDDPRSAALVIGVDRAGQLDPHIRAMGLPPLAIDARQAIEETMAGLPDQVVDPSRWPR